MMDSSVQIFLLILISVITILIAALGVQVFFILRELRKTVEKTNTVLDNANNITEGIATPLASLGELTSGLKTASLLTAVKLVKSLLFKSSKKRVSIEEEEE